MSSKKNRPEAYRVGQLLRLKTAHSFVRLHPHFVHPNQIWEPLKIFWQSKSNRCGWGDRSQEKRYVPNDSKEWVTAIKMECAWDVGAKYKIDQRDLAGHVVLDSGDMMMVMEVIVTPWKKKYKFAGGSEKRQRFSYVKFLASYKSKPIYLYLDVSHMHGTFKSVELDDWLFEDCS